MKDDINAVFEGLKKLEMAPTPNNVSIMNSVYIILKKVYKGMEEKENAENRPTSDPDGRVGN